MSRNRLRFLARAIPIVFVLVVLPASAKPGPPAQCDSVTSGLDTLPRLAGDGQGTYQQGVDGVRSAFCDQNFLLNLSAFASATQRKARVDLTSPAEPGLPSLGVSFNSSLALNVRGQIASMFVGEIRAVDALFTFQNDVDGRKYRLNFSGGNGTDLVRVERISSSTWTVDAFPGSRARLWDVTRSKAVLIGLYSMDFKLSITQP